MCNHLHFLHLAIFNKIVTAYTLFIVDKADFSEFFDTRASFLLIKARYCLCT